MSDLLLNLFSSVFTTPSDNHVISDVTSFFYEDEHSNLNLKPKLTTINFTKEDVESAIKSLKLNSAQGPDGMTGELLTNCASVISEPVAALFTKSLTEGSVPTLLKHAAVVPIYKGGDRSLPSNYTPVSSTPILMKVMEKIVRENIVTFLTENNLFNPSQHGFMKGRLCLSALLSVYDEPINNLSNCQPSCIDMIYLDFAKAFDKVDHGVLLHKLKCMGITGDLGNWLLNFLSDRKHFVRILLNFLSDRKHFVRMPGGINNDGPVLSGVPQGTVLGPLLFLVLLSDISKDINHSSVVSFADDTRVYHQIIDINDCSLLQNDSDNIYSWASVNNMVFNDSKFQHMSYHQLQHRSCNHIYLSPSMNIINSNDHTRDFGITMSGDCSFNEHINLRTKQCRQLTGWILRTFKSRDKCTMVALFKSLVLPRLEYGCQLWSPTSVNQIKSMPLKIYKESLQNTSLACIHSHMRID